MDYCECSGKVGVDSAQPKHLSHSQIRREIVFGWTRQTVRRLAAWRKTTPSSGPLKLLRISAWKCFLFCLFYVVGWSLESGFDVREAGVSLAAAGRSAEVPRDAAICRRNAQQRFSFLAQKHDNAELFIQIWPELLSDCDDLDSEMRLRRFAAATQPSLLLRRFFTNLQSIAAITLTRHLHKDLTFYHHKVF